MALLNVLGTYLFGVWGGTARKKYLLMLIYLLRTAAIALFVSVPLSTTSVYAFSSMLGFLLLSTVPLTNGLIAQIFGVRFIGTLFGILFVSHQMGSFVGIWVGGYLFETTGSYQLGWVMAVALGVIGTAVHWPIVDRPVFEDASRV
jgi:MFS family permease